MRQNEHAVFHENHSHIALFRFAGEDRERDEFTPNMKRVRKLLRNPSKNEPKGFKTYEKICRYFGYRYSPRGLTANIAIHRFFENNDSESFSKELAEEFMETAEFCNDLFGREYRFARLKEDLSRWLGSMAIHNPDDRSPTYS